MSVCCCLRKYSKGLLFLFLLELYPNRETGLSYILIPVFVLINQRIRPVAVRGFGRGKCLIGQHGKKVI